MLRECQDDGSKLAATTIKSFLENNNNSREEAIKLCDMIIEDANSEILSIHMSLDEQINDTFHQMSKSITFGQNNHKNHGGLL